jgi:LPXTG-site transpeptidase (sortase) family protein
LFQSHIALRLFTWALWGILLFSLASLAWPLAQRTQERVEGWNSQKQLQQEWQRAAQAQRAKVRLASVSSRQKVRSKKKSSSAKKTRPAIPRPPKHWAPTRLIFPRMNLDAAVVQGIDDKALLRGPGHDPASSAPGEGNCVIAAHRNMAGWWFYNLNKVTTGDIVTLATPSRIFRYRVQTVRRVSERDTSLLRVTPGGAPRLTLYSCTIPKTDDRLTVIARLESS